MGLHLREQLSTSGRFSSILSGYRQENGQRECISPIYQPGATIPMSLTKAELRDLVEFLAGLQ
jgi:hypothetical protein